MNIINELKTIWTTFPALCKTGVIVFILMDIAVSIAFFLFLPYYTITFAIALLMVFFWVLLFKPFTVFLHPYQDKPDPHNDLRFCYDVIKANIMFLLFFLAIYLLLNATKPDIIIHYTIQDGVQFMQGIIVLIFSVLLTVITTLFKNVKDDVSVLIFDAKKQATENLEESKKIHDRIESLEQGQILSKQLAASNEVIYEYIRRSQDYNVTKDEALLTKFPRIEQLIGLLKIPAQQHEDFEDRLDVVILNKDNVMLELKTLPLTRAYLLAIAIWKNTPSEISKKIDSLGLKA